MSREGATDADRAEGVAVIMNLAAKGYGQALNELGSFYGTGNIPEIPKDCAKALDYFTRAWDAKELQAAQNIAVLYRTGDCFEPNPTKAYEWTRKGAEAGHVPSMHDLGLYYLEPINGVPTDSISALGWFRRSAELGYGDSMWQLSRFYYNKGNSEESRYWLKKGAEAENMYCMHGYGLYLKNGYHGVQQDPVEAARYFKKTADMYNLEDSQMEYANLCDKTGDYDSAAFYYLMAANQGNIWSMCMLADYHIAGKGGCAKDYKAAFSWYETGYNSCPRNGEEKAWHIYCITRLGLCYYLGKGVEMDRKKGRDILYQEAESGNPVAIEYIKNLNIQ